VEIADQGIGIAADELPLVFERQFRGEAARRQRPEGSGLGLTIAQSLARVHGGHLALNSIAGKGTLARLVLPLLPTAAETRREQSTAGEHP
jgi:two-component system, OmpR family, sensor kinase